MSKPHPVRIKDPGAGLQEVVDAYNDWSSMLTNRSIEASFAVIVANWAVYGSPSLILAKGFAKWSIIVVMVFLAINLLAAFWMSHLHSARFEYAEQDPNRWQREYEKTKGALDPWPYTKAIENLGRWLRVLKAFAPLIAAGLFVVSLFR